MSTTALPSAGQSSAFRALAFAFFAAVWVLPKGQLQAKDQPEQGRERDIHQELRELSEMARKDRLARDKQEQERLEKAHKEREKEEKEAQKAAQKAREKDEKELQQVRERAEKLAKKYGEDEEQAKARSAQSVEEYRALREAESRAAYAAAMQTIRELDAPAGGGGERNFIEWNGHKIPANVYRPGTRSEEGPWMNMGGLSKSGRFEGNSGTAGVRESGSSNSSFDVRATVIRLDGPADRSSE